MNKYAEFGYHVGILAAQMSKSAAPIPQPREPELPKLAPKSAPGKSMFDRKFLAPGVPASEMYKDIHGAAGNIVDENVKSPQRRLDTTSDHMLQDMFSDPSNAGKTIDQVLLDRSRRNSEWQHDRIGSRLRYLGDYPKLPSSNFGPQPANPVPDITGGFRGPFTQHGQDGPPKPPGNTPPATNKEFKPKDVGGVNPYTVGSSKQLIGGTDAFSGFEFPGYLRSPNFTNYRMPERYEIREQTGQLGNVNKLHNNIYMSRSPNWRQENKPTGISGQVSNAGANKPLGMLDSRGKSVLTPPGITSPYQSALGKIKP